MISTIPTLLTGKLVAVWWLLLLLRPAYAQYQLAREYSGSSFFDRWQFYDHFDNLTNGDVIFVSSQVASSSQLAFVNSAGNAVIKVDNTTTVPFNQKRNTVRISTTDTYGVGSVWVADMVHVPFGCSVWPAWWSQATTWPQGGEIDTFEGVNLATHNQLSLHTEPGCTLAQSSASMSGLLNSTDCSFSANSNQGCIVTDAQTASYGAAFAAAGGGVFVTELAEKGVSIWFYPRASVPSSLTGSAGSLDTSTLGQPVANYPAQGCAVDNFFQPQHLILDITLCGDFAGSPGIFAQTCNGTCYNDWVIGSPSVYNDAYFEVKNVRVYQNSSLISSANASATGSGSSPSSTRASGASMVAAATLGVGQVVAVVVAVVAWAMI